MYEFADTTAEHDLAAAARRGVLVHVIASLDDNRELGLIISGHTVLAAMASTFAADFRNGTHWT